MADSSIRRCFLEVLKTSERTRKNLLNKFIFVRLCVFALFWTHCFDWVMQMLNFILITLKYFGSNENAENVQSQISFFNIADLKKKISDALSDIFRRNNEWIFPLTLNVLCISECWIEIKLKLNFKAFKGL